MSKTLILLAVLVIIAIVTGALAVTSFLRERKRARAQPAEPESAPSSGPQYPPQLDR
jgi:flagellar basal body-associated protein FliL